MSTRQNAWISRRGVESGGVLDFIGQGGKSGKQHEHEEGHPLPRVDHQHGNEGA